jgi:hypothetical protein
VTVDRRRLCRTGGHIGTNLRLLCRQVRGNSVLEVNSLSDALGRTLQWKRIDLKLCNMDLGYFPLDLVLGSRDWDTSQTNYRFRSVE